MKVESSSTSWLSSLTRTGKLFTCVLPAFKFFISGSNHLQFFSYFDDVILILSDLIEADMWTVNEVRDANEGDMQAIIDKYQGGRGNGSVLVSIATQIANMHDGSVPCTKKALLGLEDVDTTVAGILMQQVFASTELVVGLHARKICAALDMFDWEEFGAVNKTDVKMIKISSAAVRESLKTWLPPGASKDFHDIMHALGDFMAADTRGSWGDCKACINAHFSAKDVKVLQEMYLDIMRFSKATRAGKRRKS